MLTWTPSFSLTFTGNELYSGGEENVLVKWQLSEEKRSFLPRLGMHIRFVVTDITNTYIVTAQKDNAFSIISAKKYKAEGVIQGLAMNTDNAEPFPAGIAYDPFTRAVVLNGRTGHVQFYDLHHGKQLFHVSSLQQIFFNKLLRNILNSPSNVYLNA
nr:WD repeat-containing protein 75-like [Cherax quadricarinatus]